MTTSEETIFSSQSLKKFKTKKIIFVNDKEYKSINNELYCSVAYNNFFLPLKIYFNEVLILGRKANEGVTCKYNLGNVRSFLLPSFNSLQDYIFRLEFGQHTKQVDQIISEAIGGADIVFITVGNYFAHRVEKIARKMGKTVIIEVIDDAFSAINTTSKRKGLNKIIALLAARYLERKYRILCKNNPSLFLGNHLKEKYRSEHVKQELFFENLMNQNDYKFDKEVFKNGIIRVIYIGRVVPMKSLQDLICAIDQLSKSNYLVECRIVGYGESLTEIKNLTENLQLSSSVKYVNEVKFGSELYAHYDWADIFVLPSTGGEGVPRVLLEALGRGCLVIGTKVCGNDLVIEHNKTGILVPPNSPKAIASSIVTLKENKNLREEILIRARKFALEHSANKQRLRLLGFIDDII